MHSQPTVAGVILTLNEEVNLSRALKSLSWCNELLVLDSGSSDQTHRIAVSLGAILKVNKPSGPFHITDQRNYAVNNCGLLSDWILFLDADEEVSPSLSDTIISTITKPGSCNAFMMAPRYWFLGKWLKYTQGYPNWHPRLLQRQSNIAFEGKVWESFSSDAKVGYISEPYEHYAFSKGLDDWVFRHLRYSSYDASQTLQYLQKGSEFEFDSKRKYRLRMLSVRLWPLRPLLRFFHKYIISRGFLDGWQGFVYSLLICVYDLFVVIKVLENKSLCKTTSVLD